MRTPQFESDILRELRHAVAGEVLDLAGEFIDGRLMAHALNEQQVSVLRMHISTGKDHPEQAAQALINFNRDLRPCITGLVGRVDTHPYWALVDATGAVEDSLPQTWAMSDDANRQIRLHHAREHLADVRDFARDVCARAEQGDGERAIHVAPRPRC